MSTFELNKIVGAILVAALVSMVIGIVGDNLVKPRQHEVAVAIGEGAKAPAGAPAAPAGPAPIAPLMASASAERGANDASILVPNPANSASRPDATALASAGIPVTPS